MATTPTIAKAKTPAAKTDQTPESKPVPQVQVPGVSRREFLYYAWGASMALLLAQTGGWLIWFGLPRFREGEFGGVFSLAGSDLPILNNPPKDYPEGKFWLSNTDDGIAALYKVCTHLGCLFKWVGANDRFECPCHGSKFQKNGVYIEGPAPRSLDRFEITVVTNSGQQLVTNAAGDPVPVDSASVSQIRVNTGKRIKRDGKV
ncbi:MAG: Rieske 2Fe-2S domain-containing protein [Anaerolineae bacterium]|jgi:cytochrome b6-f complex iron-sulfur subunit|nr:Rieske 2Fe-2S domain-containing protein [Anaerolineae bacterium]